MLRIGLHQSSGFVSSLIKWQTRSTYSHASLILPDDSVLEAMQGKGVVHGRTIRSCKERVEIYETAFSQEQQASALAFARKQIGKGYDYTMVVRFVSRESESRSTSGKWFCSELVFASFAHAGALLLRATEAWEVSPGLLARSPYLIPLGTNK